MSNKEDTTEITEFIPDAPVECAAEIVYPVPSVMPCVSGVEIVEEPVVEKEPDTTNYDPVLTIQEYVRSYKQFKPHHMNSIVSYFRSQGFPLKGTAAQLKTYLQKFGW